MIDPQHARSWGIKAARAGLSLNDNPYRDGALRAAWRSGFGSSDLSRGFLDAEPDHVGIERFM